MVYKKTKKPKKPNKTKSIKSQRGGSGNVSANPLPSVKYSGILSELGLDSIKTLFETTFDVRPLSRPGSSFTLNNNLKDTFLQGNTDFLSWYNSINPEFKNISDLKNPDGTDFKMPEFEILIANLAKDLVLMLVSGKFADSNEAKNNKGNQRNTYLQNLIKNRNTLKKQINNAKQNNNVNNLNGKQNLSNKEKNISNYTNKVISTVLSQENKLQIENLLKEINEIISLGYIYKDVQKLYLDFLKLVSTSNTRCDISIKYINEIYNTPFIVFPTHYTLDFKEVVNLCLVPILNFKIMNRRRKVHDVYSDSCYQINHDVLLHGNVTHNYQDFIFKQYDIEIMKNYFILIEKVLKTIKPLYDYNELKIRSIKIEGNDIEYNNLPTEIQKLCFGIILFYTLHENIFRSNTIKHFAKTGKINKFINIQEIDINNDDDPNSPTLKYPILKQINWKLVYGAFKAKLIELGIV